MNLRIARIASEVARIATKGVALWLVLTGRYPQAVAAWIVAELLMEVYWLIDDHQPDDDEESEPPAKSSPPARPHPRHLPSSRPPAK